MALALKLLTGTVSINGYALTAKGDSAVPDQHLPGDWVISKNYIRLPEDAFTDTIGNSSFSLHGLDEQDVPGPSYAEVRGEYKWRIRLNINPLPPSPDAPLNSTDPVPSRTNAPISYLHCHCCTCFPYFELQVNEGSVRIAKH